VGSREEGGEHLGNDRVASVLDRTAAVRKRALEKQKEGYLRLWRYAVYEGLSEHRCATYFPDQKDLQAESGVGNAPPSRLERAS